MAQPKTDMGLNPEISNGTMIHCPMGSCTELNELRDGEEEVELAEEVDEDIGIASEGKAEEELFSSKGSMEVESEEERMEVGMGEEKSQEDGGDQAVVEQAVVALVEEQEKTEEVNGNLFMDEVVEEAYLASSLIEDIAQEAAEIAPTEGEEEEDRAAQCENEAKDNCEKQQELSLHGLDGEEEIRGTECTEEHHSQTINDEVGEKKAGGCCVAEEYPEATVNKNGEKETESCEERQEEKLHTGDDEVREEQQGCCEKPEEQLPQGTEVLSLENQEGECMEAEIQLQPFESEAGKEEGAGFERKKEQQNNEDEGEKAEVRVCVQVENHQQVAEDKSGKREEGEYKTKELLLGVKNVGEKTEEGVSGENEQHQVAVDEAENSEERECFEMKQQQQDAEGECEKMEEGKFLKMKQESQIFQDESKYTEEVKSAEINQLQQVFEDEGEKTEEGGCWKMEQQPQSVVVESEKMNEGRCLKVEWQWQFVVNKGKKTEEEGCAEMELQDVQVPTGIVQGECRDTEKQSQVAGNEAAAAVVGSCARTEEQSLMISEDEPKAAQEGGCQEIEELPALAIEDESKESEEGDCKERKSEEEKPEQKEVIQCQEAQRCTDSNQEMSEENEVGMDKCDVIQKHHKAGMENGLPQLEQREEEKEETQSHKQEAETHRKSVRMESPVPHREENSPEPQEFDISLYVKIKVLAGLGLTGGRRKPADLQDLAPGTNPPFVTFNGEVKVDVNKIEEFLEERLVPPRYPRLATKHPESNTAGIDVFAKFSAFIKNPRKDANDALEKALLKSLRRLDEYLRSPLPEEIDTDSPVDPPESTRSFLDGPELTLADCNLLPKLHILKVVARKYRNFEIPADMTGVWRYLNNAYQREEFTNTCPADHPCGLSPPLLRSCCMLKEALLTAGTITNTAISTATTATTRTARNPAALCIAAVRQSCHSTPRGICGVPEASVVHRGLETSNHSSTARAQCGHPDTAQGRANTERKLAAVPPPCSHYSHVPLPQSELAPAPACPCPSLS
ncbi:hypothetical protein JZ751_028136 [Albula glossodonta]|uniref:CLIC N-terminal domain-containing protein n=1 Tax=Albula glossodonta TaxID=121402 RepID=A0A8T2PJJ9_9TELE|nr:hypothetical protein JZ751_028136 [Albula glossodonta]